MNQPTTPNTVEDFLPLPESKYALGGVFQLFTPDQVRAYVLADRARLAPAAPSSTPEVDKLDRISERRAEKLSAPSEIEAARLREIARLIGAIFVYGGFKAETKNESQLEKLLRDQGVFFDTVAQYEAQIKQEELK